MMDIEDQIAKIIKDEYAPNGFEDEGHSTAAAHDVMAIIAAEIERLEGKVRNRDELIGMHMAFEEGLKAELRRLRTENAALVGK